MFPFFTKISTQQPTQLTKGRGSDNQFAQANHIVTSLLTDFPWLWAIKRYYSSRDAEHLKVSQDMSDLKVILGQLSTDTRYVLWIVSNQPSEEFEIKVDELGRQGNQRWSECVVRHYNVFDKIYYLVVVDPINGEVSTTKKITIYRHPEKVPLNSLVKEVAELYGSGVQWQLPMTEL